MIATLALLAAATAHPPNGTYHYSLESGGSQVISSTLLITSTPHIITVRDAASSPSQGATVNATSTFDVATLKQIDYKADFTTPNGPQHLDATFAPGVVTISVAGTSIAVKADEHAPLQAMADNFPGTMVMLPAMLHANGAHSFTVATPNGTSIVATVMSNVLAPRPSAVSPKDKSMVVDAANVREIFWYDPTTFVVAEIDIPVQDAKLKLTGSSPSTVALATPFVRPTLPELYKEETVSVPVTDGHLSGTLMFPAGKGPFPVALIIAGSGPTDRNGNDPLGIRTSSYRKLAEGLAAQGIATLRYDKRGIGLSKPMKQTESEVRLDDFVNDALTLTRFLEADARFSGVSIIGHSEGSLIGTIVAERDPHLRSFVSLEGPGRRMATIVEEQMRAQPNISASLLKQIESIDASLAAGKTVPDPGQDLDGLFAPNIQPYLISEYKYDPAREMSNVDIPVLIVHGSTDLQVSFADAKALTDADPHAKYLLVDGMNHVLVDAPLDRNENIATYSNESIPLDPKLVTAIAAFLK